MTSAGHSLASVQACRNRLSVSSMIIAGLFRQRNEIHGGDEFAVHPPPRQRLETDDADSCKSTIGW